MSAPPIGEHTGANVDAATAPQMPTVTKVTPLSGSVVPVGNVTAASARQFLVAFGILFAFVIVMTMLAGTSNGAGKGIAAFFVTLLVLQAITHANPFLSWVERVQLTPEG